MTPGARDVQVWRIALPPALAGDAWRALLSAEEVARADAFRFERDRAAHVTAHVALRRLLAGYAAQAPELLRFATNAHGKPRLDPPGDVTFNLSHSGEVALIAVGRSMVLGIDVERQRGDVAIDSIAARFFAPAERAGLAALPESERVAAFFRCWVRKEAFVKARGRGLAEPLDRFAVALDPGDGALLAIDERAAGPDEWTLRNIMVPQGYAAALAVEGAIGAVRCQDWTGWPS